jgi:uncharacterized protein (TIGR03083 family)
MTEIETTPRAPTMDRALAMRLAADEYQRFLELLRSLEPADWTRPTCCANWDVRAMAAHVLGMVEMAASLRDQRRQMRAAAARMARTGESGLDALTGNQVDERAAMTPEQIMERFAVRAPKAAAGRRRAPGFVRRRPMPQPQEVGDHQETWTTGYLVDVVLTRDPWLHRADLVAATGAHHELTAEHDGAIVADVVAEWSDRHGRPSELTLTGPAGGHWSSGSGGESIEMDAVDFCRVLSGRGTGTGLLATAVPF